MAKLICSALILFTGLAFAADPVVVPLWPNGAPGSEGKTAKEIYAPPERDRDYSMLTSIHNPSITVYLPPKSAATGAAVIVCPGGAHRFLAIDHEGYNIAKYLNSAGIAAFVLKYRLSREPGSTYTLEGHSLRDALRAIRLVRSRAAEWGVNPAHVGVIGFSAGGQLTMLAGTKFEPANPAAADAIDRLDSRPDFIAPIYPGGQYANFEPPANMPPVFLLCANDDKMAVNNVNAIYPVLVKAGVPAEVHIYAHGGHGFGIREKPRQNSAATSWQVRFRDWLADMNMLSPQTR